MHEIKKILFGILCALLVVFLLQGSSGIKNVVVPQKASAQFGGFSLFPPFGGRVDLFIPCTCIADDFGNGPNGALAWIHVGDPRPGDFILAVPGITRWYERYAPFLGHWILGVAWPFDMECREQVTLYPVRICVPIISKPPIKIFGSS